MTPADTHKTGEAVPLTALDVMGDNYTMVVAISIVPRPPIGAGDLSGFRQRPGAPHMDLCKECVIKYTMLALEKFARQRRELTAPISV
jgi:hypothetical protein